MSIIHLGTYLILHTNPCIVTYVLSIIASQVRDVRIEGLG